MYHKSIMRQLDTWGCLMNLVCLRVCVKQRLLSLTFCSQVPLAHHLPLPLMTLPLTVTIQSPNNDSLRSCFCCGLTHISTASHRPAYVLKLFTKKIFHRWANAFFLNISLTGQWWKLWLVVTGPVNQCVFFLSSKFRNGDPISFH